MLSTVKTVIVTEPSIPTVASSSVLHRLPPLPSWTELPDDLTANILQRLHTEEILVTAQEVCSTWWRVCKNPNMWRIMDLDHEHCRRYGLKEFKNICRCAVDLSQGKLVELKLTGLAVDLSINYATERSSELRCLTLSESQIMGYVLTEAIKKLPRLEELHLCVMLIPNPTDLETVGISCPMLKSFTYRNHWVVNLDVSEHVVAIGKTMPNLHHLQPCGKWIENRGLEAILDGCYHLKSLDLGRCKGLDMQGALVKRCSDQLKDLRLRPVSPPSISYQDGDYDSDWSYYDIYNSSDSDGENDSINYEYH